MRLVARLQGWHSGASVPKQTQQHAVSPSLISAGCGVGNPLGKCEAVGSVLKLGWGCRKACTALRGGAMNMCVVGKGVNTVTMQLCRLEAKVWQRKLATLWRVRASLRDVHLHQHQGKPRQSSRIFVR